MEIKQLVVLGKSDATLTMILDNLESLQWFPSIKIINNLDTPILKSFENLKFEVSIATQLDEVDCSSSLVLGGFQVNTKVGIFDNFGLPKEQFVSLVHQTASISSTSSLGFGCIINSLVSIAAHTTLGNFVSVNRNASIGHHTTIEDFVTINPGCNIAGNITIGERTQIGMGANIIDGISIGKNSIIGAGSLVTKNVPDHVMVYGSPAKIIKEI